MHKVLERLQVIAKSKIELAEEEKFYGDSSSDYDDYDDDDDYDYDDDFEDYDEE